MRRITKRALDLTIATPNTRLLAVGMVNTYQELREAHLTTQYTRLAQTESGSRLLAHIMCNTTEGRVRAPQQ